MPIITVHDDRDSLPSKARMSCFPFSTLQWSSYALSSSAFPAILLRRVAMILILGIRTLNSIAIIVLYFISFSPLSLILSVVLAVLGFFFIAACLALIGDMEGTREVCGATWTRAHFDAFLVVVVLLHVGILVGPLWFGAHVGGSLWVLMWLAIWGVAWVASWEGASVSLV